MTLSGARAVPWHAVARFHREVTQRAGEGCFALPVTEPAAERWRSLTDFEPGQLAGPWEVDGEARESAQLPGNDQTQSNETFIGGPCWFRWKSDDDHQQGLEWIPLIYRRVKVEDQDGRRQIVAVEDGWHGCPLVTRFLEQHKIQTAESLDEMLPELLPLAESKAAQDGQGLTIALIDAVRLVVPEIGELLDQARDNFPVDSAAFVPSTWVLFSASPDDSALAQHILHDYELLERHLAGAPHDTGGLGLLEGAPRIAMQAAPEYAPIVPLNDVQRSAVEATLAGRPVTVINGGPGGGERNEMLLSILVNAWANLTSVLLVSNNEQADDALRERLKSLDADFEIAIHAGEGSIETTDVALGRTIDLITARRSESHYGGSLSDRKHGQLIKKQHMLREMLASQVPQRLGKAIESALESHAAQREALSALAARREELVGKLRDLGVEDDPSGFGERAIEPLRKWRSGIGATKRLMEEDSQRDAALQKELATARTDRDAALAAAQIKSQSDEATSWLLAKPGFESFEQALTTLSEKLREPIEDDLSDASWDQAYDAWPSSEAAADWERKARELAALMRPAGIALKEKAAEIRAAEEAVKSTERIVQQAMKSTNFNVQREDVDEWASCYAELSTLPKAKLGFLSKSKGPELVRRLEEVERRLRLSLPVHIWTEVGTLNENGRSRLSPVIERAREWLTAREDWDRLSTVREEIEGETDTLRRRLDALGGQSLSAEVTPTACSAIASKLNEKAAVAASAAAAWRKRELRERLPAELAELAAQIRAAGAGTPIKDRWMKGAGAALMAALDAVAGNPGVETMMAVRTEILGPVAADSTLENWRRAYQAERERGAITEELEKIPARAARLSHWKSRRPASLPAKFDVADAFDGDDTHPVWAFLHQCEEWSQEWTTYSGEEAPSLEQTADREAAGAIARIREAAQTLPKSKERAWLEAFAGSSAVNEPWPVDKIKEIAVLWQPERLQNAIESINTQLERMIFDTAKEQWLEGAARDAEVLRALGALRDHYKEHPERIDEEGYVHFGQALKAQPVWIIPAASPQCIPMQPGLFDLLIIDEATECSITTLLPLVYRAKRLLVIGDPEELAAEQSPGAATERALAAQLGIEEWPQLLDHADNNAYTIAVSILPDGQSDTASLVDSS